MLEKIKYHVYDILVETDDDEVIDRIVAIALMCLILLNTIAVILETVDEYNARFGAIFHSIEIVSVTIFTIEYLLRLWVAPLTPQFSGRFGRLRYAVSLFAIVDLLAILPTFLPMFFAMDLRIIRFLRVFRLFRLFKLSRYVQSLDRLDDVIRSKKEELFVTVVMISMMLTFSASMMFVAEHEAQPDKFSDIPSAMWWAIATLTTVGYGDVYPITTIGKILGGFIAFLGIGMFALPTGILASGFAEEIRKGRRQEKHFCPYCNGDISQVLNDSKED